MADAFRLGPASFEAAIAAAKRRRVVLPSEFYGRMQAQARAAAFTVSRLSSLTQIEAVRRSLERDLVNGGDFEAWRDRMLADPRFGHLNPAHLETIYRTNLQMHHAAGRARSILENQRARPFLMYSAILDTRVRPEHAAMHGLVLPVGHEFWRSHFPPNGFNCRCQVIALSKRQAEARIAAARARGRAVDVAPAGTFADPGFDVDFMRLPTTSGPVRAVRARAAKPSSPAPQIVEAIDAEEARRVALAAAVERAGAWCIEQGRPLLASEIEFAVALRADGSEILRKRGGRSHVNFEPDEIALFRGALLVHNHPSGGSLSRADFAFAAESGLAEVIAVGEGGRMYRGRSLLSSADVSERLRAIHDEVFGRVIQLVNSGAVSVDAANSWHYHAVNAIAAARGAVWYEVAGIGAPPAWVLDVIRELSP